MKRLAAVWVLIVAFGIGACSRYQRPGDIVWVPHQPDQDWQSIASSADGTKLVAVAVDAIYTSTNSGVTWIPSETNATWYRNWYAVASSADGSKLVAVDQGKGYGLIYTSTNSGATWTQRGTKGRWETVASSADGSILVATRTCPNQIFVSTDSGETFVKRLEVSNHVLSAASSSDGHKLFVAAIGGIHRSTDSGVTWTTSGIGMDWNSIACSTDGTKLIAGQSCNKINCGPVYTSMDSGAMWASRSNMYADAVASSANGDRLFVFSGGTISASTDSGATWQRCGDVTGTRFNAIIACSADGKELITAECRGRIYTAEWRD